MEIKNYFFSWEEIADGEAFLPACTIIDFKHETLPGPVYGVMFTIKPLPEPQK